jgi:hypothetical protein
MSHHQHNDASLAFAMGIVAAMSVRANDEARQAQADRAVLREARAIRAVHEQTGWLTPSQRQTLHVAAEIEARLEAAQRARDARRFRWATETISWGLGILALVGWCAVFNDSVVGAVVGLVFAIGGGMSVFQYLEVVRKEHLASQAASEGAR